MNRRSPNSRLQDRVLIFMKHQSIKSIAELARQLNVTRPSVSRAMSALSAADFVSKANNVWTLTRTGEEEVRRLEQRLPEQLDKKVKSITRLIEQQERLTRATHGHYDWLKQVSDPLGKLPRVDYLIGDSALFDFAASASRLTTLGDMGKIVTQTTALTNAAELAASFASSPYESALANIKELVSGPKVAEQAVVNMTKMIKASSPISGIPISLTDALASFSHSQYLHLETINQASISGALNTWVIRTLGENNFGLSKIISDLTDISTWSSLNRTATHKATTLVASIAEVAKAYDSHLRLEIDALNKPFTSATERRATLGVVVPTRTTATYIGTVKDAISTIDEPRDEQTNPTMKVDISWQERAAQVDVVFRSLGARFINQWRGSWSTLYSTNPDRYRQAAHSGRELLMQALEELAPDSAFSADEIDEYGHGGRPTRKMRIKKALGQGSNSSADWVETTAKGLDLMYGRLAGVSHNRSDHQEVTERELAGLLMTLGGLLLFIVGFQNRQDNSNFEQ